MNISEIVENVINLKKENYKFCGLCLLQCKHENKINNVIEVEIKNTKHSITLDKLLHTVLGEKIGRYASMFNNICHQCIETLKICYTFIQTTSENADYLNKIIDTLTESVQNTEDCSNNKSLYICLNIKDFTTKQYYDTNEVKTTASALERFNILDNFQEFQENTLFINKLHRIGKKKYKPRNNVPTVNITEVMHDPNDQAIKCKVCLKEFLTKWSLKSHYLRAHAPKAYSCTKCPLKYGTKQLLETHMADSHTTIECNKCDKACKTRFSFRVHDISHNLSLVCPDCGRKYKSKSTFKQHIKRNVCKQEIRANPADAKYTCDYCNKKYTQKMSLRVHIQFEHGTYKVHICECCGKKFWAQSRLKAHMVKHTREKRYTCTICSKKFMSKEAVTYHTRLHTGEKPYRCSECGESFLSVSRRTDHVKRYHLMKLHKCTKCNKNFHTVNRLTRHKKTHLAAEEKLNEITTKLINDMKMKEKEAQGVLDLPKDIAGDDVYSFVFYDSDGELQTS